MMQPADDAGSLTPEPRRPLPEQQPLDFLRGEQLRLLRDCELPRDAKDRQGRGCRATVLKMVLTAIDHYGRGRAGGAYASIATLAAKANIGDRTATRAIEILQSLGLICVVKDERRWGRVGSPTNRYTIVWSELALLCDNYPLTRGAQQSATAREKQGAPAEDQSATGADQSATGADQSATGADQSATGADQSATGGALNVSKRPRSALEAPTLDVPAPLPGRDGDEDGARFFFEDEVAAVRDKANKIHRWALPRTLADRELVLKIATLWNDGELPENVVHVVLESFERKLEKGESLARPMGWLWTTLRGQCQRSRIPLERLLARTDFPRELLAPPVLTS